MAVSDEDLIRELARRGADLGRLASQVDEKKAKTIQRLSSEDAVRRLRSLTDSYRQVEEFSVGDLVFWKSGLKNKTAPEYGVPGVVVEVLDPPILVEDQSSGSSYFREPLSLKVGFIDDEDDDLVIVHMDGNRLTKSPTDANRPT